MANIVHFDLPADDLERAKTFYSSLFGWKFELAPGWTDFYLIATATEDGSPGIGGGMGKRGAPDQKITNYIGVQSIDACQADVTRLGGKVRLGKTAVPEFGYLAVCEDTEGNTFGLWEEDAGAE
ncbi:VOC family protein [Methanofollis ethanolicus]|uniref:VOC family protein n=1 Tax=Methanofollis ethanolicus TaxID=488124 RepID=UPI00082C4395|nr:VOC family protein [Methanofollis ethanolicus]